MLIDCRVVVFTRIRVKLVNDSTKFPKSCWRRLSQTYGDQYGNKSSIFGTVMQARVLLDLEPFAELVYGKSPEIAQRPRTITGNSAGMISLLLDIAGDGTTRN
ncbi:hypothetical protein HAX54_024980 [Datura stramonium]|uniref:Uncharacterized protein n=1 Tax=Datura stramonium TaxID=4076 RepID=A0ABS8V179_DATST|nr:hypothetical protein [Datura stramonium]